MISNVSYRPFDIRFTLYTSKSRGMYASPQSKTTKHFLQNGNIGLVVKRQCKQDFSYIFLTNKITEGCLFESAYANNTILPLYIYSDIHAQTTIGQNADRVPNLNMEIVNQFSENLGVTFTIEKEITKDTFAPIDILDYVYGVLHSPKYREKYKEFLKIDFPRVPYPKDQDTFWKLVKLGGEIRQIHLLESPVVDKPISKYPITGTNVVGKIKYQDGKVFINNTQYFEDVPEVSWNFYIGGYQPAQKWLKDRKDRELQVEDIRHYLKIIVALSETDRLMKEIDLIEIE